MGVEKGPPLSGECLIDPDDWKRFSNFERKVCAMAYERAAGVGLTNTSDHFVSWLDGAAGLAPGSLYERETKFGACDETVMLYIIWNNIRCPFLQL